MIESSPLPRPTDPATKASDVDQDRLVADNRELRRRLAELELETRTDPLTGLLNRRAADEAFAREAARAVREPASLCIALIDVDDFKAFNDAHGHLAGDELLRESALANGAPDRGRARTSRRGRVRRRAAGLLRLRGQGHPGSPGGDHAIEPVGVVGDGRLAGGRATR